MGKAVLASLWQGFTPAFGVHGAVVITCKAVLFLS